MAIPHALLAPILASPTDDRPRLTAADALTGDRARADFIRLQVRRAAAERAMDDSQLGTMLADEKRLERPDFDDGVGALGVSATLKRGFVQHVKTDAGVFIMRADAIRKVAPLLELSLSKAELHLDVLFDTGILDGIVSLDLIESRIGDAGAERLARSKHLTSLRWLDLRRNGLTRAGLDSLCASPLSSRLRWLHVAGNGISAPHDQPVEEDGRLIDFEETELGRELEAQHGPLRWLHHRATRLRFHPPSMSHFILD
ncbi:MAG: TIGR02996 domain-containing protein [Myxococcales bacterium]|nr:TIGR02996 domain-containing protein [Myxococcales bacterium]